MRRVAIKVESVVEFKSRKNTLIVGVGFPTMFSGYPPDIYIYSAPNNSNETNTFISLGRAGHFGQYQNCFIIQVLHLNRLTHTIQCMEQGIGLKSERK